MSGALERLLVARGERIVRVAPKLMAGARRAGRRRGKSDRIDAVAVARAAIREGVERLPSAHLDERALEIRLLVDHRDRLVGQRTALQNDVRWHLHDLWPELQVPTGGLDRETWLAKIAGRLARLSSVRACVLLATSCVASARSRGRRANSSASSPGWSQAMRRDCSASADVAR